MSEKGLNKSPWYHPSKGIFFTLSLMTGLIPIGIWWYLAQDQAAPTSVVWLYLWLSAFHVVITFRWSAFRAYNYLHPEASREQALEPIQRFEYDSKTSFIDNAEDSVLGLQTLSAASDVLLGTMSDAVCSPTIDPPKILAHALQLLRIHSILREDQLSDGYLTSLLDLSTLPRTTYLALTSVLSDLIRTRKPGALQDDSAAWVVNATLLLLSKPPCTLPRGARDALAILLSETPQQLVACQALSKRISARVGRYRPCIPLSEQLIAVYAGTQSLQIRSPLQVYNALLGAHGEVEATFLETLWAKPALVNDPVLRPIISDAAAFIFAMLEAQLPVLPYRLGLVYCLLFVVQFGAKLGKEQEMLSIVTRFWCSEKQIFRLLSMSVAVNPRARLPDALIYSTLESALLQADTETRQTILTRSTKLARNYTAGLLSGTDFEPTSAVRFALLFLRLHAASPSDDFTNLWAALATAVRKYKAEKGWERKGIVSYWHVSTQPFGTAEEARVEDRKMAEEGVGPVRLGGVEGLGEALEAFAKEEDNVVEDEAEEVNAEEVKAEEG